jgi:cell division transport system permease protein
VIRFLHLLREVGRNIFGYPITSFSSFLSLTLLFMLFDLYWVGANTSNNFYSTLLAELRMEAFVTEVVPDSTIKSIESEITAIEGVREVKYVSKEDARAALSGMVGYDLLVGYDSLNPLPRSFVLAFDSNYNKSERLSEIEQKLTEMQAISGISYGKQWLAKAEATESLVLNVGLVLGLLILLTALISSTNNIRLMSRARAVGFEQMSLLGAGRMFLILPYLVEGFILSFLSAAAGWGIIYNFRNKVDFTSFELIYPSTNDILMYCAAIGLMGVVSGYFGVRKLLR